MGTKRHLYACFATEEKGSIVAVYNANDGSWYPLVTTLESQLSQIRAAAQRIATESGKDIEIVRFELAESLGIIKPAVSREAS